VLLGKFCLIIEKDLI